MEDTETGASCVQGCSGAAYGGGLQLMRVRASRRRQLIRRMRWCALRSKPRRRAHHDPATTASPYFQHVTTRHERGFGPLWVCNRCG